MEKHELLLTDCKSVWSQIKHEKSQIKLKRRWLLGVCTSEPEQKKLKREKILEPRFMPESLIRGDDIFFDTVKSRVEEAFGISCLAEMEHGAIMEGLELPGTQDIERVVLSNIDNLTTTGLCLLAKILSGNLVAFERTRHKMKKIVRKSVSGLFGSRNPNNDDNLKKISWQITEFLNDRQNFRDSCVPFSVPKTPIPRAAAVEVLNELERFSRETLIAMHKKLKETRETAPLLTNSRRSGFKREHLIKVVKKKSMKMLSKLRKEDQLPGPLAKAMAVAGLSLKLTRRFHNSTTEFYKFSPETEDLQNEIIKAIWLVKFKTKVDMPMLEQVKNLLDPIAKVPTRSLRTAVRNLLTEYLFGCSDMDVVPESLFRVLATINKKSRSTPDIVSLKKSVDKEIECVLNVSAHVKHLHLDLLPDSDFDVDFADAYMEDLEESEDEHSYVDNNSDMDNMMWLNDDNFSQSMSLNEEGALDSEPSALSSEPFTATNDAKEIIHATTNEGSKNDIGGGLEAKNSSGVDATCKNQYLDIQETCDETSMTAYRLIGHLLEKFGHKEGLDLDWYRSLRQTSDCVNEEKDSIVVKQKRASKVESDGMTMVRVTEELIPSFPRSGIEKLERLLGS